MAFNTHAFRQKLKNGGARPTHFKVTVMSPVVGFPTEDFSFLCQAAQIPASNVGKVEKKYFGRPVNFWGDRTYEDWTTTVLVDGDMKIRTAFERWSNAMNGFDSELTSLLGTGGGLDPSLLLAQIKVDQLRADNSVAKSYILVNAFPLTIDNIELNWETVDTIEEFGVTWSYDYFIPSEL